MSCISVGAILAVQGFVELRPDCQEAPRSSLPELRRAALDFFLAQQLARHQQAEVGVVGCVLLLLPGELWGCPVGDAGLPVLLNGVAVALGQLLDSVPGKAALFRELADVK